VGMGKQPAQVLAYSISIDVFFFGGIGKILLITSPPQLEKSNRTDLLSSIQQTFTTTPLNSL
jgi:hypothetical protein